MVSQTAEYALRAVLCLARSSEAAMTTQRIARAACIPPGYLSKVLHLLCRAGVVHSRRGLHGGYTLVRPFDQVSLLDIVNAVSPLRRLEAVVTGLSQVPAEPCVAIEHLNIAIDWVEHYLASTTLHDMLLSAALPTRSPAVGALGSGAGHAANSRARKENKISDSVLVKERTGS